MFEIVVLSGKGGTGKTSISASLAAVACNEVVMADCDVDAANMHLLLKTKPVSQLPFYSGEIAHISHNQCISCGQCKDICRYDAVLNEDELFEIDPINCEGCGYCARVCPSSAIQMLPRRSGDVFLSESRLTIPVAHARLDPGADNSGKMVARVKEDAKKLATSFGRSYILVDGAPGIGCPVVSSLAGAKFVLIVTEPTLSAFHDMKRLLELLKKFRPKIGCIINKSDLNPHLTNEVKNYLLSTDVNLLAEIPYNESFTQSMLNVRTVAETSSVMHELFSGIWKEIKDLIKNPVHK